ncbi:MAG: Wadjet anti-phage system protein JetD domain-containing protein, partial [Actinomycetales bacterium]
AALTQLTPDELALYVELVEGRFGDRVRLEQERIDWSWAIDRLEWNSSARTKLTELETSGMTSVFGR